MLRRSDRIAAAPEPERTMPQIVPPPLQPDGQPDWDRVSFDPLCPRCDYNLRMLTVQRCPECGFEFEWARVFDLTRQRHAFLFEHNWHRRPVRALLVTFWRALRPWSFWLRVSLYDEVRVGPLLFVLILGILLGPATIVTLVYCAIGILELLESGPRQSQIAFAFRFMADALVSRSGFGRTALVSWTSGQLLAALMLCTLRQTLARCRVRTAHVIRVAAYAALGGGAVLGAACVAWTVVLTLVAPPRYVVNITWWILLAVVPAVFVEAGLRTYLRLPRAWFVALTFSGIGLLAMFTVYLRIVMWGR